VDWSDEIGGWVSIHKSRGHEFLRRTVWEKNLLQDEIAPLSGRWRDGVDLINDMSNFGRYRLPRHTAICVHRILVVVYAILLSRALCFVAKVYHDE
jgi:hypothetical protein